CFSTSSLLAVYGLNETLVNETTFARVCPAVVQQVSNQACRRVAGEKRDDHVFKEPELKAWGYGFLATTIVNIAPLIGVTVVPFMSVAVYKTVLLFMVSLAVGVLCGGSVFHLIPMVKPIAWTIVIGDCVHNFIDGVAIGAAFSSSVVEGISTALAILGEEVPHELGDFAVLLSSGMKYRHAVLFNLLSGVICYTGLVLGLLLAYATASVQWIYAIAAGMFLYISLVDMLPEANEMSCKEGKHSVWSNLKTFALQNSGMLVGFSIMLVLAIYAHDIEL
ncbi:predicted protein, partial [Nematostella vectensis]